MRDACPKEKTKRIKSLVWQRMLLLKCSRIISKKRYSKNLVNIRARKIRQFILKSNDGRHYENLNWDMEDPKQIKWCCPKQLTVLKDPEKLNFHAISCFYQLQIKRLYSETVNSQHTCPIGK